MREGAAGALGHMAYSYGYVARVSGTETATSEDRTMQNETTDMKEIKDGELTLIETQLDARGGNKRGHLVGKNGIKGIVGGYTKKKFILIGVGDTSNKVEFQGLVTIVDGSQGVNWKCLKDVLEGQLKNNTNDVKKLRDKFGETGLFWKTEDNSRLSLGGQIVFGNCLKEFYKRGGEMVVVESLKEGTSGKRLGFQKLEIPGGMSIALTVGMKLQRGEKEIIAPGVLVKNVFTNGRTLWAGLQGDGVVLKSDRNKKDKGQGNIVIHDWFSTNSQDNPQNLYKKEGSEDPKEGIAKKIPLKNEWNWYLWDPSYTEIKQGKLKTKDGKDLPFNIEIGKFVETELIK
ncbi:hypothetical protein WEN_03285 [Mycoplasma wenyonii str. Massachusetts]|uniref:Uncharacterized protein n=1 Tax=Mycoplasma wenyonii (strain Massachusetts) TaxID=1197325 RepID=I6YBP7_MYCWM|nr:hypothetical protein [Mycoplasma wenyonii]AFN65436.1 hypothetical protein WEN_03285 [Mycoplasma wenyonii str. Massachusetts]